ncbi:hypothetical protein FFLO_03090 [Filobasidium floriforme]|uniref:Uncharacterized protein n=1 Tax=Filobasidium floriforme TaxID=5210 RepID=A0A8K0JLD9_9TREE|nr:hypothetical protein FFLO_03090 [Filobasidium floriforme]
MLRSLPSRKPSSSDNIDIDIDTKLARNDKDKHLDNKQPHVHARNKGSMIPPPAPSTSKVRPPPKPLASQPQSQQQPRPSTQSLSGPSRTQRIDQPDLKSQSHPLNDVYQVIHTQTSRPLNGSTTEQSGPKDGRDKWALHTFVDETGKWVKFRVYGMVEVEVEVDRDAGRSQREDEKVKMKQKSDSGRGQLLKVKTDKERPATRKKVEVEASTDVRTVQTVRRTTRTRSAIKQEDAVTLQPVQGGRSRGGLKRKRSGDPAGSEVDIELQSARYQHDAIGLDVELGRGNGNGSGSETELEEDSDHDDEEGGEGNEDEDEDEDEDGDEDITIDDENDGHAIRQKAVLKVKETKVGLWKGYLRLSKVQSPHTPQSIRKAILEAFVRVEVVPNDPLAGDGPRSGTERERECDIKVIIDYPSTQVQSATQTQTQTQSQARTRTREGPGNVPPQIVGCQFALPIPASDLDLGGGAPKSGAVGSGCTWGEEGLKGWWDVGCKMITGYNRTSTQLLAIEEKKTRPLPSCTPPTSAGNVPTFSSSQPPLQVPASSSQDGQVPGMLRRGSGVKNDPTYEDYLMMVKEVQMLKMENRQLAQENSALKGGYAGKLTLSQQQQARANSQSGGVPTRGNMAAGMSKIQPGIRKPPKIETGFASSSDED